MRRHLLAAKGGTTVKVLFICSRNQWRSLTAEKIFDGVNGHQVRSAGTEHNARIKVTGGHVGWADIIFVMERKHIRRLQEKFGRAIRGKPVHCLDISDDYPLMDAELIDLLRARVSDYIDDLW